MRLLFTLLFLSCILFLSPTQAQVSVTATGTGPGPTTYTDFTTAFAAINAGTHTGAITVTVTANFSQSTIGSLSASGTGAASYTSVLIKPAASTSPVITSTADLTATIKLDGADNVTIDGSNNGTTSRDMTFQNSNTAGSGQAVNIWIASNGTNGATNNVIKNCKILGSSYSLGAAYMGVCILSTYNTMNGYWQAASASTGANNNNLIQNNLFNSANAAVVFKGGTGIGETGNQIIGNIMGDVSTAAANKFTNVGIYMMNQANFTIDQNTITWMNATNTNVTPGGISIGPGCTNGNITRNAISNLRFTSTAGNVNAGGIVLNAGTGANINIYNNLASDIASLGSVTPASNAFGISIAAGGGYNIGYNSIHMNTNPTTTATGYLAALYVASGIASLNIRNNLFINSAANTTNKFSIYSVSANPATSTINYNDYYTTASVLGYAGANLTALTDVHTSFQNGLTNSKNVFPAFVLATDLHLIPTNTTNTTNLAGAGTPITGVTVDYDNDPRNPSPTIGADELASSTCATPTGLAASGVTTTTATLTWTAVTGATGYEYVLDQLSGNPAGAGTPTTAVTYAAGPLTPFTTYYMHIRTNCGAGGFSAWVTISFTTLCIPPTATITAAGPLTFCTPGSVVLNANTATGLTYQWKLNTVDIPGATTASYTATASGNYTVVTTISTCNTTSSITAVTVLPRPDTAVTMTPASGLVCSGRSVSLSVPAGTGLTYQWFLNNAAIAGATSNTYNANASGNYRIRVANSSCNDTSAARTVTVLAPLVATITTGTPTTICAGNSILLTGPAPATGITYQWQLNSANIAGATSDTYTAITGGNYRLVMSNGTCADTSAVTTVTVNPQPVATATAGGPAAFCTGGSVILSANTGTGLTYKWLRTGFVIAGATAATYTATTTGNYAVIVTNSTTGCSDTSDPAISVTVSAIPSNVLTLTGTLSFCQGGNVRFQAAVGAGYTYVWYKDASIIPGATAASYTATAAGVYYCVITNGPCVTTTGTRTVVVNPLPTAAITAAGPTAFCIGGSVILDANTGTGLTYQWRLNTVNIPGATSPSYTATASGAYTVVVSNGTCSNTSNIIPLNVSTMPVPVITPSGPVVFCQGNNVTLNATAGIGFTYQWQLNGTNITGATAAAHYVTASGNYTVTITNGTCVATSAPFTVTVTPGPVATITPAGPTSFCQGGSVLFNAPRGTGYTYQWSRNSSNIAGANSWQYTAMANGSYTVEISDGTCTSTSGAVTVTVNDFPVAVITVTGGTDMSTGTFASYQWYRNGVLIPGAIAQNYSATRDGYYSVVVTDALGCSATSNVQQITALDIPEPGANMHVSIWPNPAEGIVHVAAARAVNLSITSVDGKELLHNNDAKTIDMTHLPQGLYLIRISDAKTGSMIRVDKILKK